MKILWADLETYSTVPISHGTHAYAAESEILIFAYAIDDEPVKVWDVSQKEYPTELTQALKNPDVLLNFHNSFFDRTILEHQGYTLTLNRFRDTMVKAMTHSLPGGLDLLSQIFKLEADQAKDKRGKQLIQLFCKPRPEKEKLRRATHITHPKEWAEFVEYARLDVEAMRAIDKKLPSWNYKDDELALWHLDQKINSRGFQVDIDLARAAVRAVDRAKEAITNRTQALTDYDSETGEGLKSTTQRDAMLKYLVEAYGVDLPDTKASTIQRRMEDPDLPDALRELLALRLQASTSSTSKYTRVLQAVASDGRLKGTLQFCGATRTGRWAGRMFQPQNLPRPSMKTPAINLGIEALKANGEDLIFDNVMDLTSNVIRGVIVAPANKKLVVADLANIEGRVLAWLAGEDWKLKAFYAFDAGEGEDLYKLTYARGFNISAADVTSDQRQIGKVQELALGYQGGVGAFLTFATGYNLDLQALTVAAYDNIPEEIREESISFLSWLYTAIDKQHAARVAKGEDVKSSQAKQEEARSKIRFGLTTDQFIVCDSFKRSWRYAHPEIVAWWRELEDAARNAITNKNKEIPCRKVTFTCTGAWLKVKLPSGRFLCYPSPQIGAVCSICKGSGEVEIEGVVNQCPDCGGESSSRRANQLSYMGINQYSRKWSRIATYGGKIAENITQAVARDVLASAFINAEKAGYEIVLTVHDEIISETPDAPEYSVEALSKIMSTNPAWAKGLPLAAAGFEDYRYRKG